MVNERVQILQMVQEGKITPDEAEKLLAALDMQPSQSPEKWGKTAKWLRIRVVEEGSQVVNINLPMAVVEVAVGMGLKFVPQEHLRDIDIPALMQAIKQGVTGKIVEVDEGDTRVEISVE